MKTFNFLIVDSKGVSFQVDVNARTMTEAWKSVTTSFPLEYYSINIIA